MPSHRSLPAPLVLPLQVSALIAATDTCTPHACDTVQVGKASDRHHLALSKSTIKHFDQLPANPVRQLRELLQAELVGKNRTETAPRPSLIGIRASKRPGGLVELLELHAINRERIVDELR